MTYTPNASKPQRSKLIHSNLGFAIVPLGLCAFAAAVHWLVALAS